MYTEVSDTYKQVIAKNSRHFAAKIQFEGVGKIWEGKEIYSIKYDGGSSNTDYLTVGAVVSASLTVELIAHSVFRLANRLSTLYIGLEIADDEYEWIPMGRYKVLDVQTKEGKTTLQCQDRLALADRKYISKLSYPAKISEILEDIHKKIWVKFDTHDYPDYTIQSKPTGYTIREMISMIAQMWGCFAVCGRDGNVDFRWYSNSNHTIDLDRCGTPEIAEDTFTLGYLTCYYDGDNYYQQGNPEAEQGIIIENPYISESLLTSVYNKIKDYTYHAAKIDYILADPRIDVWDIVDVADKEGTISIPVMSYTWDFDGGFSGTIEATVETATETEYRTGTAAASKSAENSAGTTVYYAALAQDKSFSSLPTNILSIEFAAKQSTVPIAGCTIQLDLTAGGCVDYVIIYDNATLYTFSEVYAEGKCCKSLAFPILGVGNGSHALTIAIKSDTATGKAIGGACLGYVMGSNLAEKTAWNGSISIRQHIDTFEIKQYNVGLAPINDIVTQAQADAYIDIKFRENNLVFTVKQYSVGLAPITDTLPTTVCTAYNDSDIAIYLTMRNPITSSNLSVNLDAFEILTVIGTTTRTVTVATIEQVDTNTLKFTMANLGEVAGTVSIAYYSDRGNLIDCVSGDKISDFVTSFVATSSNSDDE